MKYESTWTIAGQRLAELLRATRESFLQALQLRQLSERYLRQSRFIIDEYADFCADQQKAHPWQLRQKYLVHRVELSPKHPFSASYLKGHSIQLRYFLRWYQRQVVTGKVTLGELPAANLRAYWATQRGALPYRHKILCRHLKRLLAFLQQQPEAALSGDLGPLLRDYFKKRHSAMRGKGGIVLNNCAKIVTRRHLVWLEEQGHLPDGTAPPNVRSREAEWAHSGPEALRHHFAARIGAELSQGVRQPLLEYLDHLAHERQLVKNTIKWIFRTNWTLCRHLAKAGHNSFARLRITHLDEVVSSLVSAPRDDLLRRRQQVQARHSELRGFLRYLHRRGLVGRDLASALISPPCYRASKPPTVPSEEQVQSLLESVDRRNAQGRRCYAILLLMTTYGLRPVDVSRLRLDDLHWREQRIGLVQHSAATGRNQNSRGRGGPRCGSGPCGPHTGGSLRFAYAR